MCTLVFYTHIHTSTTYVNSKPYKINTQPNNKTERRENKNKTFRHRKKEIPKPNHFEECIQLPFVAQFLEISAADN